MKSSQYKGVCKHQRKWQASIFADGKVRWLGLYEDERDAALAYDCAARELHGHRARLNFPEENTDQIDFDLLRRKSRYKGVYWSKSGWVVFIKRTFAVQEEAARAHDAIAAALDGDKAKLNFPATPKL